MSTEIRRCRRMGGCRAAIWKGLLAALRTARVPVAVVVSYLLLGVLFDRLTERQALLTPVGAPHLNLVALGLLVMALRLTAILLLPGVLAYQVVLTILEWMRDAMGRRRAKLER